MLILIGTVNRVNPGKPTVDRTTGETTPAVPVLDMLHTSNEDPNSDQELIKIKLKDPKQVESFQRLTGQLVRIPVRTWQSGEKSGFWLEKGVLPTAMQPTQTAKAA
jgi:hypothetical protein